MSTCGDDHTRPTWLCSRIERFTRSLDDYIAGRALSGYSRQFTVPQPGRRAQAADQLFSPPTSPSLTDGGSSAPTIQPPRESSRYERARVASLAVQNAIRAAAHADDQHRDQPSDAPHAVDHPGRDAVLTPAQRAAAVQAHQQAAMPQEYLEGRTTDPATWMRTPANLKRLAAITRAADARRRALEDRSSRPRSPTRSTRAAVSTSSSTRSPAPSADRAPDRASGRIRRAHGCGSRRARWDPPCGTGNEVAGPHVGTRPAGRLHSRWTAARLRGPTTSKGRTRMIDPTGRQLSPQQLQQQMIRHLVEVSRRRRAALYLPPKPPQRRRRTRQYPCGRPNLWWCLRLRRHHQGVVLAGEEVTPRTRRALADTEARPPHWRADLGRLAAGAAPLMAAAYCPGCPATTPRSRAYRAAVLLLAQVQEAAQPYAGLSWLAGRTVCQRDGAPCGEQFPDGEGGLVIGGRDLHHGQARRCHMCLIDLPHAWHHAVVSRQVLAPGRLHSTGYAVGVTGFG